MDFTEIEDKDFLVKFSFNHLMKNLMFLEKILSIYPDENCQANKECRDLFDSVVDQLSDKDRGIINHYFTAIRLENTFEEGNNEIK